MKTKSAIKSTLAVILAAATALLSFCSCSLGKTKIDIEEHITVAYSSFNKHAKADMTIDYDSIEALVDSEKMKKYFAKVNPEEAELYDYFGDSASLWTFIDVDFAQEYENLANGDIIVVTATPSSEMESAGETIEDIEKGLGISIKDAEIKVEGLVDAKEIDLLKDIDKYIAFEGTNGKGTFKIEIPEEAAFEVDGFYFNPFTAPKNGYRVVYNNEDIGSIAYKLKSEDNSGKIRTDYAKGEICTIIFDYSELKANLEELGYVAKAEEYEVTVPDLGEYITSKDQLTQEDMEILRNGLLEHMTAEGYANPEIMATYYSKINPGVVCDEDLKDIFVCIIAADKQRIFTTTRGAFIVEAYGIIKNADGEIRFETEESWTYYDSEESAIAAYNQNYTLEKIS